MVSISAFQADGPGSTPGRRIPKMEENETKQKRKFTERFGNFHNKHYKTLLIIPAIILLVFAIYIGVFYAHNGDFIHRDISLTGGTSVTLYNTTDSAAMTAALSPKLEGLTIRTVYDLVTHEQKGIILETESDANTTRTVLENYLGYNLTIANSSFQFSGSSLSQSFFSQLLFAIVTAFLFMGSVVFLIFGKKWKTKLLVSVISLIPAFAFFAFGSSINFAIILSLLALAVNLVFYFFYSIPSAAVVLSAFADIFMTLAVFDIFGMQMSTAGIVAFLMLIGYSVDTDILLTNRALRRHEHSLNERIYSAFKTGMTMTLTSLIAIAAALVLTYSFSTVLASIFTILVIGLLFDMFNTWITNASIIKWYAIKHEN